MQVEITCILSLKGSPIPPPEPSYLLQGSKQRQTLRLDLAHQVMASIPAVADQVMHLCKLNSERDQCHPIHPANFRRPSCAKKRSGDSSVSSPHTLYFSDVVTEGADHSIESILSKTKVA
jgi:hypothetical protein